MQLLVSLIVLLTCFLGWSLAAVSPAEAQAVVDIRDAMSFQMLGWTGNFSCLWPGISCVKIGVNSTVVGIHVDCTFVDLPTGYLPTSIENLVHLISLNLTNCPIDGTLHDAFGTLSDLSIWVLIGAPTLSGQIPSSISKLTTLTSLVIQHTNISSDVPDLEASASKLTNLSLSHNQLNGSFPQWAWSKYTKLTLFDISHNNFTGAISEHFGELPAIEDVDVSNNSLSGPIPASLFSGPPIRNVHFDWNFFNGTFAVHSTKVINCTASANYISCQTPECCSNYFGKIQPVALSPSAAETNESFDATSMTSSSSSSSSDSRNPTRPKCQGKCKPCSSDLKFNNNSNLFVACQSGIWQINGTLTADNDTILVIAGGDIMAINGSLNQLPGNQMVVHTNLSVNEIPLQIAGVATLNGTLVVFISGGQIVNQTIVIMEAEFIKGRFASVTMFSDSCVTYDVAERYTTTQVLLDITSSNAGCKSNDHKGVIIGVAVGFALMLIIIIAVIALLYIARSKGKLGWLVGYKGAHKVTPPSSNQGIL